MKKFLWLIAVLALLPVGGVLAVGSGGGGGGGSATCSADTFSCTDWGSCAQGARKRQCVVSFDCPGVETATPATGRTCVASTPAPSVDSEASELKCGKLATLAKRVRCRLQLSAAELEQELHLQYLPEECRPLLSAKQEACIARYEALRPCWDKPVGKTRTNCAAKVLGLLGTPASALKQCAKLAVGERKECQGRVRDQVHALIKFRFYDLSKRAEDAREKGVALDPVVKLVTAMEQTKQDFNKANTHAKRRALVLKARADWRVFARAAKGKERALDYLDQALLDLWAVR